MVLVPRLTNLLLVDIPSNPPTMPLAMSMSEESNNSVGCVEDSSANVLQHGKSRESSDQHKAHRRVSGHKDPLGLQEPLSAKAKVQNYLERFDQDGAQGSATGTSGFKPYSQTQWK